MMGNILKSFVLFLAVIGCMALLSERFPAHGIARAQAADKPGRVVFSYRPILFEKEKPETFTTTFFTNEKVYARVYLPRAAKKTVQQVFVDGEELYRHASFTPGDHTTYQIWMMGRDWRSNKLIDRLKDRAKHHIRVLIFVDSEVVAQGQFTHGAKGVRKAPKPVTNSPKGSCNYKQAVCLTQNAPYKCTPPWIACLLKSKKFKKVCRASRKRSKKRFFHRLKDADGDVIRVRCDGGYETRFAKGGSSISEPITAAVRSRWAQANNRKICEKDCSGNNYRCRLSAKSSRRLARCRATLRACRKECVSYDP